ncbi:MAG: YdiU family protein [Bacteriovorax sp.]|nr:YdiU family protein [Bacteriovorax sp.]
MNTKPLLKLADLNFSNRLKKVCPHLFVQVASTPLKNPVLLHTNLDLLNRLELDPRELEKSSFTRFLNGDLDFEGLIFSSTYYSGHQFGYYVPRLGDGRAIMLGEVVNSKGEHFELQLKGAGLTPFSRMGDGKAVVRSSIREYLASAHLKALNIPTTEALAIIHGSDDVYREVVEKAAIVLRVSESFLRFGHFQYFANTKQEAELKILVDFTIDNYFKEFADHPNRYVLFFQSVVKKTAKLFAAWQSVGFAHGVLNTDNMSILGLTIDYGPFGFIDNFDLDHICNHSDHEGRYSFGNQPPIGLWNLEQLGIALQSFIKEEDLKRTLDSYPLIFHVEYRRLLKEKLGLYKNEASDEEFLKKTLNMLVSTKLDYTQFFRELSHYQTTKTLTFPSSPELTAFLIQYEERLSLEKTASTDRQIKMLATNPKFILRNYLAQIAIENYDSNPVVLFQIFEVLSHPYEEWTEFEEWSRPAPIKYKNLSVSCSS